MEEITLYGAGGHSYATVALIKSIGRYDPVVILDDSPTDNTILGIPVEIYLEDKIKTRSICISIGNNEIRKKIAMMHNYDFPTFIHNSATVYPSVSIGIGSLIHPQAVIDADVELGDFCIVNNNATVSHNAKIGNFVHIAIQAAVAGGTFINEGALIGAGSVILPGIKIGKWSVIGAGAIVTKDVPDYAVVYGNPAKIRK